MRPDQLIIANLSGRGDKDTDLYFIHGREGHKGQIQPAGAIVLDVFGRQCLGFKSAGETDIFEAIASAAGAPRSMRSVVAAAG